MQSRPGISVRGRTPPAPCAIGGGCAPTLALVVLLCAASVRCAPAPQAPVPVRVLFAGSLIIPFDALEKAYEAGHPGVDIQMEGHGSIQVIRHVTELREPTDVVVTADHALIPMLMYTSTVPETGQPYARWYVKFATNRLALAYSQRSRYAAEVNDRNWYEVITRPGVLVGLADPRFDAAGYRALMALQLAEDAYDDPKIFDDAIPGRFKTPITAFVDDESAVIHVPEIVEAKKDTGMVIRGASIQLIALLESGDLDYAFEYESVIEQHGLQVVRLPGAVNLGDPAYASAYARVQVQLDFQRFASVKPVFTGEVIGYGVTIPTNAPHPEAAADFVAYLLSDAGQALLARYHHPAIVPPQADHFDAVPAALQSLCVAMP